MMKVGLFFGTFNPIHIGHLVIANHMAEYTDLDQVWLVVTPHNPLKKKSTLLDDYQRLEMVHMSVKNHSKISVCDIEFCLKRPSYTSHTLAYLIEKYPLNNFALIVGQDSLETLDKWKDYEHILENHNLYAYPRITSTPKSKLDKHPNVYITQAPIIQISASFIRNAIKQGKDAGAMLPEKVWNYIKHHNFYKK